MVLAVGMAGEVGGEGVVGNGGRRDVRWWWSERRWPEMKERWRSVVVPKGSREREGRNLKNKRKEERKKIQENSPPSPFDMSKGETRHVE